MNMSERIMKNILNDFKDKKYFEDVKITRKNIHLLAILISNFIRELTPIIAHIKQDEKGKKILKYTLSFGYILQNSIVNIKETLWLIERYKIQPHFDKFIVAISVNDIMLVVSKINYFIEHGNLNNGKSFNYKDYFFNNNEYDISKYGKEFHKMRKLRNIIEHGDNYNFKKQLQMGIDCEQSWIILSKFNDFKENNGVSEFFRGKDEEDDIFNFYKLVNKMFKYLIETKQFERITNDLKLKWKEEK